MPDAQRVATDVRRVFDERVGLDAAPLALPHCRVERRELRERLAAAAQLLVRVLATGGYRIVGLEVEVARHQIVEAYEDYLDAFPQFKDMTLVVLDGESIPVLDDAQRAHYGKLAADAAAAIGYEGAGTVEMLRDKDGKLAKLAIQHMELRAPDDSGRRRPMPI